VSVNKCTPQLADIMEFVWVGSAGLRSGLSLNTLRTGDADLRF